MSTKDRTYWDIVRAQFAKQRSAVWGLRVVAALFVIAVMAPILAQSSPFAVKVGDGSWQFPWFGDLLDQNVFPTGVDLFFNLVLILSLPFAALWFVLKTKRRALIKWGSVVLIWCYLSIVLPVGIAESGIGKVVLFPQHVLRYAGKKTNWIKGVHALETERILANQKVDLYTQSAKDAQAELDALEARLKGGGLDKSATFNLNAERKAIEADVEKAQGRLTVWQERLAEAEKKRGAQQTGGEDAPPSVWSLLPPIGFHHDDNDEERIVERPIFQHAGWGTTHYLGTDQNGRDVLARILYGTRVSLTVGVIAVSIYCTIGIIIGSIMGFFGGWIDILLMRLVEIMICFPTLAFILIIVAVFQTKSIFLIVIGIAVTGWTGAARLIRGQFLQERSLDYVTAARSLGIPTGRIVFKHVLPNAIYPIFVTATFGVAAAILTEASLAFLGLGDPNVPSWGQIMLEGRVTGKLWLILSPGFAIFLTVTVLNLVGEGLRDALDPKLRQ